MQVDTIDIRARGMVFDALAAGPTDGELVLLLHGFPQSAEIWRAALETLASAGHRAVAVNQRGYATGARPQEVDAYRLDELAEDARSFIAALGHTRAHVIGHDWGGSVAWTLAASTPQWVSTLIVLSTPHLAALGEALRHGPQRQRMLYIPVLRLPVLPETMFTAFDGAVAVELLVGSGLRRSSARRDVARLRKVGPSGPLNWYRAVERGTAGATGPVEVPTMYVWGDGDVAVTREAAELTEQHVHAPYHFVELDGASHWIPDQHWDDITDLVTAHLRGA
jgi:pimeloyl-ACP methyl ester carboxylesterase